MTPPSQRQLAILFVTSVGVNAGLPWLGVLLGDAGLTPDEVALALLILPISGLVGTPAVSWWADRANARRQALVVCSLILVAGACMLQVATQPLWLMVSLVAVGAGRSGQSSLIDATTMSALAERPTLYGRLRAWGTGSFVVLCIIGGVLQGWHPTGGWWLPTLCAAATLAAVTRLGDGGPTARPQSMRALLRHPTLIPLALVGILHGATLGSYDNLLAMLHADAGYAPWVTGASLAVGATAELCVFAVSPWLLRSVRPETLWLIALASGVPRWFLTATAETEVTMIMTQALHGLGFGAYWLAGVSLFARHAPRGLTSSAQALFTVSTFGLGTLTAMATASLALRYLSLPQAFGLLAIVSMLATLMGWRAVTQPQGEG